LSELISCRNNVIVRHKVIWIKATNTNRFWNW